MLSNGRSVLAAIVLAVLAQAASTMPAAANAYKEFRAWAVFCTNGLTCTLSYSTQKPEGLNMVSLRRISAPQAPVSLVLPVPDGFSASKAAGTLEISVDGKKVLSAPVKSLAADSEQSELTLSGSADTKALVEAMKAGQKMRLAYAGAFSDIAVTVPLNGVVAGLLFMDEAQGRLKRTDALVAKGDRQPPAEGPARDIASFAEIPAAIRSEFESDTAACGGISPDLFRDLGAFEARFDEETALLGLPCGAPGAYNALYSFFAVTGGDVTPLALPVIGDGGPTVETSAYNVDYDPARHRLTAFYKGRGLGDCGTYQVWTLEDRGMGPAFVLKEQRQKDDCDGNYAGGPEKWPRAWPPR